MTPMNKTFNWESPPPISADEGFFPALGEWQSMTKPNRAGTIAPLEFPLEMNLTLKGQNICGK